VYVFVVRFDDLWAQCEEKQGVYGRSIRWMGYMTHMGDKRNALRGFGGETEVEEAIIKLWRR
jgi:hypothetical protein